MSKMVIRLSKICILVLVFTVLTMSQVSAQGQKGKPKGSDNAGNVIKKISSSNVIMVVKLAEIEGIRSGKAVGSNFIFKIEKVVKFEAGKGLTKGQMSDFYELSKRNGNLKKCKYVQFGYAYFTGGGGGAIGKPRELDKEGETEYERLLRLLKKGKKYILAAPITSFCPYTGTQIENKWGSVRNPLIEKYSRNAMKRIESLLKKADKNALSRKQLIKGYNEFAIDLYGKLKESKGNLFFSPLGVCAGLSACYSGARGQTAAQMEKALFSSVGLEEANLLFAELFGGMNPNVEKDGVKFGFAGALWGQKGIEFQAAFAEAAKKSPGMKLRHTDFKADAMKARQAVNEWAAGKTGEKFPELAGGDIFSGDTKLALASVSTFTGKWAMKFDNNLTQNGAFAVTAEENIQVPMMYARYLFNYTETDSLRIIELPYNDCKLTMVVLLPKRVDRLSKVENSLSPEKLGKWLSGLVELKQVKLYFPKFELACNLELKSALKSLGMVNAFSAEKADFSGITGSKGTCIDGVVHGASMTVTEDSGTACSASHSEPIVFRADRPFLFLIKDNATGLILYMGRLINPKATEK